MEALHAAAFHFQNGPVDIARERLANAGTLALTQGDETVRGLLVALGGISEISETDPVQAYGRTEEVRLTISEWSCLTAEMHDRFHAALPPIP